MSQGTQSLSSTNGLSGSELLAVVYGELRRLATARLARESNMPTLQPTALVHEAYLRLMGGEGQDLQWQSRSHFFAAAAEAMRRVMVESARRKQAAKRGGEFAKLSIEINEIPAPTVREDLLALDEALNRLNQVDPDAAQVVHLRYFGGLTLAEVATVMEISPRSVDRLWAYARAWLRNEMATTELA